MEKNYAKEILDAALHPVRMRILMLLSGSQGQTPQQMAEQMGDVPQATLYRHINRLFETGLLAVVEERPVRGTLEKVYALNTHLGEQLEPGQNELDALNALSKSDHLRYFTTFVLTLLDDFSRYLNHVEHPDLAADGVGYHKLVLVLSDEELTALAAALNQALAPFIGLEDSPERKKRLFSTVMMPSGEGPDGKE